VRKAIRLPASQASPAASDPAMNSARPASHSRRLPYLSTAQVVNGMVAVTANRKPVEAQPIVLSEASSVLASVFVATAAIVLLRMPSRPPSRMTAIKVSSGRSRRSSGSVELMGSI
jgi:hypothetical protein